MVAPAAYADGVASSSIRVAVQRTRILPRWVRRADAAAGRAVNRRHAHPLADRFWVRLSGFADRGVLRATLERVPIRLLDVPHMGIIGAASWYLRERAGHVGAEPACT